MNKEQAAKKRFPTPNFSSPAIEDKCENLQDAFIAGAEWAAGQGCHWVHIEPGCKLPKQEEEFFWDGGEGPPAFGRYRTIGKFDYVVLIDSSGEEELCSISDYTRWLDESGQSQAESRLLHALKEIIATNYDDHERVILQIKKIANDAISSFPSDNGDKKEIERLKILLKTQFLKGCFLDTKEDRNDAENLWIKFKTENNL